ncbi:hypothetical protein HMPREF3038_02303 [Akkermansia sp. KLE1797]|nr:hypothetical protein HMPREF3038_02303 [Akkermansia sp. KLE1797]KZA03879.1 hypothetical protein HMPREF1326_02419 [Akkermansia sp. KLE1605]
MSTAAAVMASSSAVFHHPGKPLKRQENSADYEFGVNPKV